jgi:acyl carrier protein
MSALAEEALKRGVTGVVANLVPTSKNQPARDFLDSLGEEHRGDASRGSSYRFPVSALLGLKPQPAAIAPVSRSAKTRTATPSAHKRPDYQAIAQQFSTAAEVHEAMHHESRLDPCAASEPMTELESRLACIWCDLLKRPAVPLSGNFFDLGGHSLLAVALIMRVKQAFDIELPIDDVYAAGLTLGDLARKVEAHQHGAPEEYDAILRELESLSDEEVERLLAAEEANAESGAESGAP